VVPKTYLIRVGRRKPWR